MTSAFLLNIKAEFLKLRRTSVPWLTVLAAAFIPAINCIICIDKPDDMIPKFTATPWITFLRFNWKNTASIILPFYVILLINLVVQIEFRNLAWKQVYTLPRTYADIFFSKFILIHVLIIFFLLLFNAFILASAFTVNFIQGGYPFNGAPIPWYSMILFTARIYTGILAVTALQYWLSVRFRNFIIPLSAGLGLWIAGLVLFEWEHIIYYPYMYATLFHFIDFAKEPQQLTRLLINAWTCFALAVLLGFINIYRLKEKG